MLSQLVAPGGQIKTELYTIASSPRKRQYYYYYIEYRETLARDRYQDGCCGFLRAPPSLLLRAMLPRHDFHCSADDAVHNTGQLGGRFGKNQQRSN